MFSRALLIDVKLNYRSLYLFSVSTFVFSLPNCFILVHLNSVYFAFYLFLIVTCIFSISTFLSFSVFSSFIALLLDCIQGPVNNSVLLWFTFAPNVHLILLLHVIFSFVPRSVLYYYRVPF